MIRLSDVVARACGRVYLLIIGHLLWVAGILLGGVILGIGPATFALYTVVSEPVDEPSARVLSRRFVVAYREFFWRANALWGVLSAGGLLVWGGAMTATALPGAASLFCRAALLAAAAVLVIAALMAAPAARHLGLPRSPVAALRSSLLYGIARLPVTLVGLLAAAAVVVALLQVPGLALVLGANAVFAVVALLESRRSGAGARVAAGGRAVAASSSRPSSPAR